MKRITFIITLGLPGSGKSMHAERLYERLTYKHNKNVDMITEHYAHNRTLEQAIYEQIKGNFGVPEYIIIDTHIRNMKDLAKLKEIVEYQSRVLKVEPVFEVHLFKPNLQNSLVNDFNRSRELNTVVTIKHMYDNWEFDTRDIVELFGNILIEHFDTYEPSAGDIAIWKAKDKSSNSSGEKLCSDSWTLYSWSRHWAWDEEELITEPEEQPEVFQELQDFLKNYLGDEYTDEIYEEAFKLSEVVNINYEEDWYAEWKGAYYRIYMDALLNLLHGDINNTLEEE